MVEQQLKNDLFSSAFLFVAGKESISHHYSLMLLFEIIEMDTRETFAKSVSIRLTSCF